MIANPLPPLRSAIATYTRSLCTSTEPAWPPTTSVTASPNRTDSSGSSSREGTNTGRSPAISVRSATRAERFADRTALNVATASTSVPPAVASDEIVTQSAIGAILGVRGRIRVGLALLRYPPDTALNCPRSLLRRLELFDVDGLRTLRSGFLLVGHLGALRE